MIFSFLTFSHFLTKKCLLEFRPAEALFICRTISFRGAWWEERNGTFWWGLGVRWCGWEGRWWYHVFGGYCLLERVPFVFFGRVWVWKEEVAGTICFFWLPFFGRCHFLKYHFFENRFPVFWSCVLVTFFVLTFVRVVLLSRLSRHFIKHIQVHRRGRLSASMTLNVDLNSANECQCTSVLRQKDRTQRDETVQTSTKRGTTANDAIEGQHQRSKYWPTCNTRCQPKASKLEQRVKTIKNKIKKKNCKKKAKKGQNPV